MFAIYRQGDVLLVGLEKLPDKAVQKSNDDRIVLAWGEVTGHAHAVSSQFAQLYVANEERFLVALEGAQLTHEEHSPIALVPGVYKVVQQREYTPGAVRNVAD
jgi:hypothetical protein